MQGSWDVRKAQSSNNPVRSARLCAFKEIIVQRLQPFIASVDGDVASVAEHEQTSQQQVNTWSDEAAAAAAAAEPGSLRLSESR